MKRKAQVLTCNADRNWDREVSCLAGSQGRLGYTESQKLNKNMFTQDYLQWPPTTVEYNVDSTENAKV